MTVYLLTAGERDDYHVIGVFSNREQAEAAKAAYNAGENDSKADIEGHELDAMVGAGNYRVHYVQMDARGDVERQWSRVSFVTRDHSRGDQFFRGLTSDSGTMFHGESAVSPEQATKVADETRQKWLREQAAVPPGTTSGLAEIDDVC